MRRPELQRDIAKVLDFLGLELGLPGVPGCYQSRARQAQRCDQRLRSPVFAGLGPCRKCSPGHTQVSMCLDSTPQMASVIMQLPRFREDASGRVVKHWIPLGILAMWMLPKFVHSSDLECKWVPYRVRAAIVPVGPNINASRWRAVLFDPGRWGQVWCTDGNGEASGVDLNQSQHVDEIPSNCYV